MGSETTGAKVFMARRSAGVTQERLAQTIGCSQAYLSALERGHRRWNETMLGKVAAALGLRVSTLLGEDGDNTWQEGFEAGLRAARSAIDRLTPTNQTTEGEDG